MALLLIAAVCWGALFYLLGVDHERTRPDGTRDQRRRAVRAEERAAAYAEQLQRAGLPPPGRVVIKPPLIVVSRPSSARHNARAASRLAHLNGDPQ